ncbi:rhodopsin, GQ-coupled-like [Bolinopsis microptera]|uniref:rhodopsin, GQ-coupled-like n=1 Tax=Bolinopsis microptera TaxID=2820187 RepID=UPI003079D9C8
MFVCVFGFIGNTLVTIATMYRKAFSGDNISIVFVRNLAIADLLYILIQVVPDIAVRLNSHQWILGPTCCFISAHAVYIPGAANMAFIFSISLYRLLSCKFPFQFRETITIQQANVFSIVVWAWSVVPSVLYLCHNTQAVFQPLTSDCEVVFQRKGLVNLVIAGPYVVVPFLGLITCNIWLYCIARKSAARLGKSARQALVTIGAVSVLFTVSWLPYIARKIVMIVTKKDLNWPMRPDIMFYELSIFGNPIIYTVVNERFKVFLKNQLFSLIKPGQPTIQFYTNNSQSEQQSPARKSNSKTTLGNQVAKGTLGNQVASPFKCFKDNRVSSDTITVQPLDQSFLNSLRQNEQIQHSAKGKS